MGRLRFPPQKGLLAEKRLFYADLWVFCTQYYLCIRPGQKLCKFAKKVIAPDGFDDYYKQFGCKD
jgi:hypothetical protein